VDARLFRSPPSASSAREAWRVVSSRKDSPVRITFRRLCIHPSRDLGGDVLQIDRAVDFDFLDGLLSRFAALVCRHRRIAEVDINPLVAAPGRILALDGRVVLHGSAIADEDLPRPALGAGCW
jgi:hypothetical protein